MTSPKTDIPDDLRVPLLQAALVHVPFDGWSDRVLALAARDLDLDPGLAELAFPGGVRDMIDLLATSRDREMLARCRKDSLSSLKTGQKITLLIRRRIETGQDIREAVGRTVTFLSLPPNSPLGVKILARTVDLMWKAIDDPSTDFNYYTKRLTLSGVYSSTLLYWLNDESENYQDTWDFLDRRITNVMQFEKTKAKFRNMRAKLPDLWQKLPRLWPSL